MHFVLPLKNNFQGAAHGAWIVFKDCWFKVDRRTSIIPSAVPAPVPTLTDCNSNLPIHESHFSRKVWKLMGMWGPVSAISRPGILPSPDSGRTLGPNGQALPSLWNVEFVPWLWSESGRWENTYNSLSKRYRILKSGHSLRHRSPMETYSHPVTCQGTNQLAQILKSFSSNKWLFS